jgi:hypothetical protein
MTVDIQTKYKYIGDRFTDPAFKGQECVAIRNLAGKCIRGRNGSMLVHFTIANVKAVVIARLLRKKPPE